MSSHPERGPTDRVYAVLLRLYPRAVREEQGDEYAAVFRYEREHWRAARGRLGVRFWIFILRDAVLSARREWREPLDPAGRRPMEAERGGGTMGWLDDLRYAGRRLRRSPGFTLVAVTILVLGIGVCSTAFSVVDSLLLRPPPFVDPERVVEVLQDSDGGPPSSTSYPAYLDITRTPDVFSSVSAFTNGRVFLERGDELASTLVEYATASYLDVIGLTPSRGVWFGPEHDDPTGPPAAVMTYGMWRDRFASDPAVLGSTLRINGAAIQVIGIGPPEFNGGFGPTAVDVWLSISALAPTGGVVGSLTRRQDHPFTVRARLAPAVSMEQASVAMDRLAAELARTYPEVNTNRRIHVLEPMSTGETARLAPAALFAMIVTLLILAIATLNLANLLVVRSTTAAREMAVRVALGAGRARVMRVVMSEALLLSAIGGAGGLAVAALVARVLRSSRFDDIVPVLIDLRLDVRVVLFTALIAALTALVFGLVPSLRASRRDVNATLRDQGADALGWGRRIGLTGMLVSAQVAASLLVLSVAGAFVESLLSARGADPGFAAEETAYVSINATQLDLDDEGTLLLFEQLEERFRASPAIADAATSFWVPGAQFGTTTLLLGSGTGDVDRPTEIPWNYIAPEYFRVMGIPLLHGRLLSDTDMEGERVAVVSEAFARRYWGRADVVGEAYRSEGSPEQPIEIVGVVRDATVRSLGEEPTPSLYWALDFAFPQMNFVLRADGPPSEAVSAARSILRETDTRLMIIGAGTMTDHLGDTMARERLAGGLLGVLGLMGLLIAAIGIYGVVNYAVSRRRHEVGIRIALGAKRDSVVGLFVRDVSVVMIVGALLGVALAVPVTRAVGSLFTGASTSLLTMAVATALLMVTSLLATVMPALRATRIDPREALRLE